VRSGTIKKRKSFVPETIKKRLESYPGWSDLVRLRKNGPNNTFHYNSRAMMLSQRNRAMQRVFPTPKS